MLPASKKEAPLGRCHPPSCTAFATLPLCFLVTLLRSLSKQHKHHKLYQRCNLVWKHALHFTTDSRIPHTLYSESERRVRILLYVWMNWLNWRSHTHTHYIYNVYTFYIHTCMRRDVCDATVHWSTLLQLQDVEPLMDAQNVQNQALGQLASWLGNMGKHAADVCQDFQLVCFSMDIEWYWYCMILLVILVCIYKIIYIYIYT